MAGRRPSSKTKQAGRSNTKSAAKKLNNPESDDIESEKLEKAINKKIASKYAGDLRFNEKVLTPKQSRAALLGIVELDVYRVLDRKGFVTLPDRTLDEIIYVIGHLYSYLPLCDTCEEPATRVATMKVEDKLDRQYEYACDCCKFSNDVVRIRETQCAEGIRRANELIEKLKERR